MSVLFFFVILMNLFSPSLSGLVFSRLAFADPSLSQEVKPQMQLVPVYKMYQDQFEREYSLRKIGQLKVTNLRGAVEVRGWSKDKVKIQASRIVEAHSLEDAKKKFESMDLRFSSEGGDLSFSAHYGKGLSLEERLIERKNSKNTMKIIVYAPSNLKLDIWTIQDGVVVENWKNSLSIRGGSGDVKVHQLRGKSVVVNCPGCSVEISKLNAALRVLGGDHDVKLSGVQVASGKGSIYVETTKGRIEITSVEGEQLYVSKAGSLVGSSLSGVIEFNLHTGNVSIQSVRGFVSGSVMDKGNISIQAEQWQYRDRAFIETANGNIEIDLPRTFWGEVDLWAAVGEPKHPFLFSPDGKGEGRGLKSAMAPVLPVPPMPPVSTLSEAIHGRVTGTVRQAGEQFKVLSKQGSVNIRYNSI